jgi:aminotransferase EvaB
MNTTNNFLPNQYEKDASLDIAHNYLDKQFSDHELIWEKIKKVVIKGDFTLGKAVDELEGNFSKISGTKHAVGVGSGTDALFLSLKALEIGPGDEVITTPYTFYATIGAITTAGATPIFADIGKDYNIDPDRILEKITKRTKAILPVHWSGLPCNMNQINAIAKDYQLKVIEDACHAVSATYHGAPAGSLGDIGCFSFHPLKNLNVWGDGGIITTNSDEVAEKLRLLRNHGLVSRDECRIFAYNSRLDTIQAVIAMHMLEKLTHITKSRINNAEYLDGKLSRLPQIEIPQRVANIKQVFHLYMITCQDRDALQSFLITNGVDAKIHYPTPMHLQPAASYLNHSIGDFPICEDICNHAISLPVHEFISPEDLDRMISLIYDFYGYKENS